MRTILRTGPGKPLSPGSWPSRRDTARKEDGTRLRPSNAGIVHAGGDRVAEGGILGCGDRADPKGQGRIRTRPGRHPPTVAPTAAMLADAGQKEWAEPVRRVFPQLGTGGTRIDDSGGR